MMDNRIFNINGKGQKYLQRVLELALDQSGFSSFKSWAETSKGLVLYWTDHPNTKANKLLGATSAENITPMVFNWLSSPFAKTIELDDWDSDIDQDGHNSEGWRVFCEDWGHVDGSPYAVCCITPAFMWHGK